MNIWIFQRSKFRNWFALRYRSPNRKTTYFHSDVYTKLVRDSTQPDSVLAKLAKFNCSVSNELLVTYSVANVKTDRIPTKCILDDNKLYICLSDVEEYPKQPKIDKILAIKFDPKRYNAIYFEFSKFFFGGVANPNLANFLHVWFSFYFILICFLFLFPVFSLFCNSIFITIYFIFYFVIYFYCELNFATDYYSY